MTSWIEAAAGEAGADADAALRQRAKELLVGVVEPAVFGPGSPLAVTAHHLPGEPVPPAEAVSGPFEPFAVGDAWGPRWGTTWFRLRGRVPTEWAGEQVVLRLDALRAGTTVPGGEFLIFSMADGRPVPLVGLSFQHAAAALYASAAGGEEVDLHVEAAANPTTPEDRMVGFDWPELRADPGGEPGFVLTRCELAVRRPVVRDLARDLRLAIGLAFHAGAGSGERRRAHDVLSSVCAVLDPDDVPGSAPVALEALAALFTGRRAASLNGHGRPAGVTAVGHAHIDTAWLWPLRETIRKCARTFATAVTLMEDHPEYRFVCSAAQHLAWIEEHYPELFARIGERVRTGQFIPVGGMWVEADCNMASGEALVRQLVLG
ncbi:MAG TPA: alpha-mannosidase, partial [Acidimicrobiia bacterium]|nr:alpha-mannosidase [Acidimicrobiia bacterium]